MFHAMNEGKAFGGKALNQFNGGLFAPDADLEKLHVPNSIFCQHMQGQNEASLYTFKETVLYLCASYNFAGEWAQGLSRPPVADGSTGEPDHLKSVGLYTLGRIFEQSITKLEIREAEVDGRPSINKESKRDGVYYTPEWVVERIVDETLRPRLDEIKRECGWPSNKLPKKEALDAFIARLKTLTVVDPACGSGAFLITTLRYLLDTWHAVREQRRSVTGEIMTEDDAGLVRNILKSNVYGVDTNSASAEIARLALWLHTARGDKPLSSLDTTIREGNSLISSDFFKGQINLAFYGEVEKERINAFDWEKAFPEVFERGGFDAVVGNPPYVKLQGLITSADAIYHLDRRGPRRYLCSPRGKGAPLAYEVEIEDEVMQPLVSGADSRRYIEPRPTTYILFPYVRVTETMHLIDTGTFQQTHPRAWKYLCSYDAELRAREATRDREGNI